MSLSDWCPSLITDHHTPALGETASATFDADRQYRYMLTRRWDLEWPMACFIMCNPSTADAFKADSTIRRCEGFARAWGAGGLMVLNLFAYRTPRPKVLYVHDAPEGPDNDQVLSWVFSLDHETVGPVIAAWGIHGVHRGRGAHVTQLLESRGISLHCLGTTKGGHPRHPLYLPNGTPAIPFTQPAEVAS